MRDVIGPVKSGHVSPGQVKSGQLCSGLQLVCKYFIILILGHVPSYVFVQRVLGVKGCVASDEKVWSHVRAA